MCGEGGDGGDSEGDSGLGDDGGEGLEEPRQAIARPSINAETKKIIDEITKEQKDAELKQKIIDEDKTRFDLDTTNFNTQLGEGRSGAFDRARGTVEERGLDFNNFEGGINSELDRIVRGLSGPVSGTAGFADPRASFEDDIASIVLNNSRDLSRRNFETAIDSFGGEGFAQNSIRNDADDAILQSILDPQFADANTSLDNAFSQGNLSRAGLDRARITLGEQQSGARSNLDQIGGDVLSQGRSDLRDIRDRGIGQARGFELGQSFTPGDVQGRLDTSLGDFNTNLEGNIRNAVGSAPLFDVNSILANTRQTAFNPAAGTGDTAAPGLLDTLADRDKKRNESRGVGNTGAF